MSDEVPAGEIVADGTTRHGRFYTVARRTDGVIIRYPGLCEFEIGPDLDTIEWRLDPGSTPEFASILASGTVLAVVLLLRGELVLHASAVEVDGHAFAVVGAAGMGKSTLAALLAQGRGTLLTDDVLRVGDPAGVPVCYPAAREVRLRESAASLAAGSDDARTTADGRTALRLGAEPSGPVPLRAVAIPFPDREQRPLLLERAGPAQAHLLLARYPRVLGWQDPATGRDHFHQLADLVERVPVYRLRIPWGPPFPPDLPEEILEATGWGSTR